MYPKPKPLIRDLGIHPWLDSLIDITIISLGALSAPEYRALVTRSSDLFGLISLIHPVEIKRQRIFGETQSIAKPKMPDSRDPNPIATKPKPSLRLNTLEQGGSPSQVAWDAGVQGAGSRTGLPQLALCCNLENTRRPIEKEKNKISHQIPQNSPPIRNHGGCCKCWYSRTRAVLGILFDGK